MNPLRSPRSDVSATYFRREFPVTKTVRRARVYSSALGNYQLYLNGKRIGDDVLAPGWTDYHKRVVYQVYDVTKMVQPKANAIGAILGGGWYADALGWKRLFFGVSVPNESRVPSVYSISS